MILSTYSRLSEQGLTSEGFDDDHDDPFIDE
jgi:hypothetical protein